MCDLFGLLAPFYERVIHPPDGEALHQVLRLPPRGARQDCWLLDAGGGTGRVTAVLHPFVGHCVVADLSQGMLREATHKGTLLPVRARVQRLPFADETFHRIVVVDALHHFDDKTAAIVELMRVLRPGGRLVFGEPDITAVRGKLIALAERLALINSHFWAPTAIEAAIRAQGYHPWAQRRTSLAVWVGVDKPGPPLASDASAEWPQTGISLY